MMHAHTDTIYALATPQGRSGIAIIRVSGPNSLKSLKEFLSSENKLFPPSPRTANLCSLYRYVSRETKQKIDSALVVYFKGPDSFTGENVVEYYLHGSPAIIQEMINVLSSREGHRQAEPGEFTRRAFENGRLDLTEAEAVADLIDAETITQKNQALAQLSGTLKNLYQGWADDLKRSLAFLEAHLDFPDEDLPQDVAEQVRPKIETLLSEITGHMNDNRRGERLRDGLHVAIVGAPNAGKSSLVNVLAQREVAIVSDLAGTTRDVVEVHLDLGGYPVILSDTAGLRPEQMAKTGHDKIESEGIRRARQVAEKADLKILLFDGSQPLDQATLDLKDRNSLCVINKVDLCEHHHGDIAISVATGQGMEDLLSYVTARIQDLMVVPREAPSLTRTRHREALGDCVVALDRSLHADLSEMMAEDLRLAVRSLGRITGQVDVEDLLDVIFKEFCIGK